MALYSFLTEAKFFLLNICAILKSLKISVASRGTWAGPGLNIGRNF